MTLCRLWVTEPAHWRCEKWIQRKKITLVHRLLLWVVRLPEDISLINVKSLYKVNVKCIKKIIAESVFRIANAQIKNMKRLRKCGRSLFLRMHCIGPHFRRWFSFMQMILILGPAPTAHPYWLRIRAVKLADQPHRIHCVHLCVICVLTIHVCNYYLLARSAALEVNTH